MLGSERGEAANQLGAQFGQRFAAWPAASSVTYTDRLRLRQPARRGGRTRDGLAAHRHPSLEVLGSRVQLRGRGGREQQQSGHAKQARHGGLADALTVWPGWA